MEEKDKKQKDTASNMESGKLRELFVDELKDILWAEKALTKAMPKMMKAATSEKLAKAFELHLQETEQQIQILEQVFELLGEKPEAKKCEAMAGLVKEAENIIDDTEKDTFTRDVGLILAGQKVEHYEIASYGGLIAVAEQLGETEVAKLLQKIFKQEKKTDMTLSMVAEGKVNKEAAQE